MGSGTYNGVRHIQWSQAHTMESGTYNGVRHIQWGKAHTTGSGTYNGVRHILMSFVRHYCYLAKQNKYKMYYQSKQETRFGKMFCNSLSFQIIHLILLNSACNCQNLFRMRGVVFNLFLAFWNGPSLGLAYQSYYNYMEATKFING